MEINKQIAKALLNKSFAEAKEFVFKSLYAKASLALDEARFVVANSVFNEAAKTTGVPAGSMKEEAEQIDELLTPMRDKITARERDKATADYNNPNLSAAQQKKAAARASRATYARLRARSNDGTVAGKAQTPKFKRENEKWRKVEKSVKEEVDQLDEVSPPGMEKMTGSKKTKASFAKQYGKRGKSVMYATAWKLHNKKAKD